MKNKPKVLNYVAALLFLLAPSLPTQIMVLYGHTPFELDAIAAKLTPLNWMIFFLAPVTAWLVWRASRYVFVAVPILSALVAYNNWFVGVLGRDYPPFTTALGTGLFVLCMGTLFTREARAALLNPAKRWWQTPRRKLVKIPVRMQVLNKNYRNERQDFYTVTYDLSRGGAFIPFGNERGSLRELRDHAKKVKDVAAVKKNLSTAFVPRNLKEGTQCYVSLNLRDSSSLQCRAEIVRITDGTDRYPAGVGLRFLGLSWEERRKLERYLDEAEEALPQGASLSAGPAKSA